MAVDSAFTNFLEKMVRNGRAIASISARLGRVEDDSVRRTQFEKELKCLVVKLSVIEANLTRVQRAAPPGRRGPRVRLEGVRRAGRGRCGGLRR